MSKNVLKFMMMLRALDRRKQIINFIKTLLIYFWQTFLILVKIFFNVCYFLKL